VELDYGQQAALFLEGQQVKDAGLSTSIRGIRAGSDVYEPLIVAGRWLSAQDTGRVLVIPRQTSEDYKINLGDLITLDLGVYGKEKWQVIGLYEPVFVGGFASPNLYAPMETLYKISKKYNRASQIMVRTTAHDEASVTAITKSLKERFERHSLTVAASTTQLEARATSEWQFSLVTTMLLALSVIVAVVGGIALMGALSIGVIERTKEIGVLRAIGARSRTILGIFVMEGILQGLISWMIAIPLSLAVSPIAAMQLGQIMFGATLDYQYNWVAVGTWFGIVVMVSLLASILPARGATRISVRDSLAYA
jgi:putative ABC transport system permease protein